MVRTYYRLYWDFFGLSAHTFQLETPFRLTSFFTLSPLARFYTQKAARYFQPYAAHSLAANFYTSDYDLSAFTSYTLGLTLRYAPYEPLRGNYSFQAFDFRYSYYKRSDGLLAHNISLVIEVLRSRVRK